MLPANDILPVAVHFVCL